MYGILISIYIGNKTRYYTHLVLNFFSPEERVTIHSKATGATARDAFTLHMLLHSSQDHSKANEVIRPTAPASGKPPALRRSGENRCSGVLYVLLYHTGWNVILYIYRETVVWYRTARRTPAHARERQQ
jgi:hypothetical protein